MADSSRQTAARLTDPSKLANVTPEAKPSVFSSVGNAALQEHVEAQKAVAQEAGVQSPLQAAMKESSPAQAAEVGKQAETGQTDAPAAEQKGMSENEMLCVVADAMSAIQQQPEAHPPLVDPGLDSVAKTAYLVEFVANSVDGETRKALAASEHYGLRQSTIVSTMSEQTCAAGSGNLQELGLFGPLLFEMLFAQMERANAVSPDASASPDALDPLSPPPGLGMALGNAIGSVGAVLRATHQGARILA